MAKLTKSGEPDRRTKEYRRRASTMPAHEVEGLLKLAAPAALDAERRRVEAWSMLEAYRQSHPELAELERAAYASIAACNEASLPLFQLVDRLRDVDEDAAARWIAYLNGHAPTPNKEQS